MNTDGAWEIKSPICLHLQAINDTRFWRGIYLFMDVCLQGINLMKLKNEH